MISNQPKASCSSSGAQLLLWVVWDVPCAGHNLSAAERWLLCQGTLLSPWQRQECLLALNFISLWSVGRRDGRDAEILRGPVDV